MSLSGYAGTALVFKSLHWPNISSPKQVAGLFMPHPPIVALTIALHGPCSPRVLTQRKAHHAVLPASLLWNSIR